MKKIFGLILICMFLLPLASAELQWDNVKSYDAETRTVTITNLFGLGKDYAEVQLLSDLNVEVGVGYQQVAEFEIRGFTNYNQFVTGMDFYDMKGGMSAIERNFDLKSKHTEQILINDYKNIITGYTENNTAIISREIIGTHYENLITWEILTPVDITQNDNLTIGIFTNVQMGDFVEWIPSFARVEVEEWASWEAGLNTNLISYWAINESSGTNVEDLVGIYDGTAQEADMLGNPGKLGNGGTFSAGAITDRIDMATYPRPTTALTVSAWVNYTGLTNRNSVIVGGDDQNAGNMEQTFGLWVNSIGTKHLIGTIYVGGTSYTVDIGQAVDINSSWFHAVMTYDGNNLSIYYNGVLMDSDASMSGDLDDGTGIAFGADSDEKHYNPAYMFAGKIDEVGIWDRALTPIEISYITNNGDACGYVNCIIPAPTIVLNAPANDTTQTSPTVLFNSTISIIAPTTVSLYIDGSINETNTSGDLGDYLFNKTLEDGLHTWIIEACADNCINSSERTITIDTTTPAINLLYPTNTTYWDGLVTVNNKTIQLNWSASDTNLDTCWYNNETINITITCNTNTTLYYPYGLHTFIVYANDSFGNLASQSVTARWNWSLFLESEVYTTSLLEGSPSTFKINVLTNGTDITIANLTYNSTGYLGSLNQSTNNFTISRLLNTPIVSTDTNLSFYWNLTQGTLYSTATKNQTVVNLGVDDCSVQTEVLYNFTMVDEKTQSILTPLTVANTTGNVNLQIYNLARTTELLNYTKSFLKVNPFAICLSSNFSGGEELVLDAQVEYLATKPSTTGYETEFYHIQNETLTNADFPTNITLYDLDNVSNQDFLITYKDENFLAIADALIQIKRKYIGEGLFKTVEIPKTGTEGEVVGHLEKGSVIYTFVVVKNGVILATFNNMIASCESLITPTCVINLNGASSTIPVEDFTTLDDFSFTLTYDDSTRAISSVYVVPSNDASTIILNATLNDNLGTTNACTDTLVSSSGTLSCVIPLNLGNGTATVRLYKDGTEQGFGIIDLSQTSSDLYGASQVFILLILFLTIFGMGISDSPVMTSLFIALGLILAITLNVIDATGFIGKGASILWLFIAIAVIIIKGDNRN